MRSFQPGKRENLGQKIRSRLEDGVAIVAFAFARRYSVGLEPGKIRQSCATKCRFAPDSRPSTGQGPPKSSLLSRPQHLRHQATLLDSMTCSKQSCEDAVKRMQIPAMIPSLPRRVSRVRRGIFSSIGGSLSVQCCTAILVK
jgi:hypothetical protein